MTINSGQRDYRYYQWQRGEKLRAILVCVAVTVFLAYFFLSQPVGCYSAGSGRGVCLSGYTAQKGEKSPQ